MSKRFDQLQHKHRQLLARCDAQRAELAVAAGEIEGQLGRVDHGIAVVKRIVRSPMMIAAGVAIIGLIGPRRLIGWVGRAAVLLTTSRRFLHLARSRGSNPLLR